MDLEIAVSMKIKLMPGMSAATVIVVYSPLPQRVVSLSSSTKIESLSRRDYLSEAGFEKLK